MKPVSAGTDSGHKTHCVHSLLLRQDETYSGRPELRTAIEIQGWLLEQRHKTGNARTVEETSDKRSFFMEVQERLKRMSYRLEYVITLTIIIFLNN